MKRNLQILFLLSCLGLFACKRMIIVPDDVTEIPKLTDFALSGNQFNFMDTNSRILVRFRLWDRDRDFGNPNNNNEQVEVDDIRSDTLYRSLILPMPDIPRDILEADYLVADITIPLKGVLFTPRNDSLHIFQRKDTLVLKIRVRDEAGNYSNELVSDPVFISP